MEEFKMEDLSEDLLLNLHTKFPNTIEDGAKLLVGELRYEKGKAHGCIYSGNALIVNEKKGIRFDFSIWFSVYCEPYGVPKIRPDIKSYITGKYGKIEKISQNVPDLDLKAVILLNIPEISALKVTPENQRYFDAFWHVFYTDKGNAILSKEGWFDTYVYDPILGMRPIKDDEWVDVPSEPGWRKPKGGLEMVESGDLVKEFMIKRYNEKIAPNMYVEL